MLRDAGPLPNHPPRFSSLRKVAPLSPPLLFPRSKYIWQVRFDINIDNHNGLHNSMVGATTEMLVSADLLEHGLQIFRAVSADANPDLIALTPDGKLLFIECKSGYRTRAGTIGFRLNDRKYSAPTIFAVS